MNKTVVFGGDADLVTQIDGDLALDNLLDGEVGVITTIREGYPEYTGETVITPNLETQVLRTAQKTVLENITINPIPSNYGLITWNGSTLTVS